MTLIKPERIIRDNFMFGIKCMRPFFFIAVCLFLSCSQTKKSLSSEHVNNATIKVLAYNIHHANPPSKPGVIDVDAIANVIKKEDPHLVALQEVDVHTTRSGKELNQARALAEETGMQFHFAKAIDYDGGQYGVAILSKYNITDFHNFLLPTLASTNGESRVLATALVELPGGRKLRFACTHLDAQRADTNRILQMDRIIELLQEEKLPVILAGDLNAVPGSAVINKLDRYLQRSCTENCEHTIPETKPNRTIDFIAFSPDKFRVKQSKVIAETYASDHRPVLAVLEF